MNGYAYVHDKFSHAKLTPIKSDLVSPARIMECPAQMEAELVGVHEMMQDVDTESFFALEVKVLRTQSMKTLGWMSHRTGLILISGTP